jgi:hypothetical protein
MIDKLLRRIARRSAPDALSPTIDKQPTHDSTDDDSDDPFHPSYPLHPFSRSARTGQTAPGASNPWHLAVDAYLQGREGGAGRPDLPVFFAEWGTAHLAVAQLLWAEHDRLHMGGVHIYSADRLLAVVWPRKRKVLLQASAYRSHAEPLVWKILETDPQNTAPAYTSFTTLHMHSLLWFYGQAYSHAPELLPQELGTSLLQLRRLPHIEPAALDIRHLALIRVFSAGALSFAQLQRQVAAHHADHLCADIASLYFTGTLHLIGHEPLPSSAVATSP